MLSLLFILFFLYLIRVWSLHLKDKNQAVDIDLLINKAKRDLKDIYPNEVNSTNPSTLTPTSPPPNPDLSLILHRLFSNTHTQLSVLAFYYLYGVITRANLWNIIKKKTNPQEADYYWNIYKNADNQSKNTSIEMSEKIAKISEFILQTQDKIVLIISNPVHTQALNILGLNSKSAMVEIHKRYKKLSLKFHPDRNPINNGEEFIKIKQAYDQLKLETDLEKRFFEQLKLIS